MVSSRGNLENRMVSKRRRARNVNTASRACRLRVLNSPNSRNESGGPIPTASTRPWNSYCTSSKTCSSFIQTWCARNNFHRSDGICTTRSVRRALKKANALTLTSHSYSHPHRTHTHRGRKPVTCNLGGSKTCNLQPSPPPIAPPPLVTSAD